MNKQELVRTMAEKSELTQGDVKKVLEAFQETVLEALQAGDKVQLVGFGSFEVVETAERKARNPQTGEEITVPAGVRPKFKFSKNAKEFIKE